MINVPGENAFTSSYYTQLVCNDDMNKGSSLVKNIQFPAFIKVLKTVVPIPYEYCLGGASSLVDAIYLLRHHVNCPEEDLVKALGADTEYVHIYTTFTVSLCEHTTPIVKIQICNTEKYTVLCHGHTAILTSRH